MYQLIESIAGKSTVVDQSTVTDYGTAKQWAINCLQFNGAGYHVVSDNGDKCTIDIAGDTYTYRIVDTHINSVARAYFMIQHARTFEAITPNAINKITKCEATRAVLHATQCQDCKGGDTTCSECPGYDSTDICIACERIYLGTVSEYIQLYSHCVGYAISLL